MFLRKIRPRGRGSKQVYWELVESYRTAKGSRQRTVAYLGKLARKELSGWRKLSSRLGGQPMPEPGLFEPRVEDDTDDVQLVDLKDLRLQRLRNFGDVFVALTLWKMLGLDTLLSQQMPSGREMVPWSDVAAILCIARFCRPSSELHIEKHFYPQSALEDLLGVESAQVHTDRLYEGLDQLLKHKTSIESHLRQRLGELFELSYEVLLYDLTSTYFEGQCAANPQAKRGYSRDNRGDCPQVVIALIVTTDGYPLGYEVFAGNTADSTTVQEVVEKVETQHGKASRIWIMDRGNVSEANLSFIRSRGGRYIVGTPKALLRSVQGQITDEGWQQVREGIEVKLLPQARSSSAGTNSATPQDASQSNSATPADAANSNNATSADAADTLVLCRSQDRVAKESAMLKRFVDRMEEGLTKLQKSAESGRLRDIEVANQRLGRLQEKNWRANGCFAVNITAIPEPKGKARLQVSWTKNEQAKQSLCGCYLLRTNLTDIDPVTLWKQYIQLVDAEWAFRISKDELELRPIWHQNEKRVQGHILVCFIAFAMWKTLGGWMKAGGLGEAPRPLVEELSTIKTGDVVLPTRASDGRAGPTLVVRCVTRPDEHQAVLLQRLGMQLPNQLARFHLEEQPTAAVSVGV